MATKDWKKIVYGEYGESWENKINKEVLTIRYPPEIKFVEVREETGYILVEKEFKTKEQAISFAKKLMRKNSK